VAIKITCIKRAGGNHVDAHHAVLSLTWKNDENDETGSNDRLAIHEWLKNGGTAYVLDARGNTLWLAAREHANGVKYVQTHVDNVWTDTLLGLPECR
jgi:hypothetical protein